MDQQRPADPLIWPMLAIYAAAAFYGGFQLGLRSTLLFDFAYLFAALALAITLYFVQRRRERNFREVVARKEAITKKPQ